MNSNPIKNLSIALIWILLAILFTGCFTTNTTFTQRPIVEEQFRHQANLTTSSHLILIPQNIGANYHMSSPGFLNDLINVNAFAGFESHRKTLANDPGFSFSRDSLSEMKFRTQTLKLMVMPSIRLSQKYRLGLGLGMNHYFATRLFDDGKELINTPSFSMNVFQLNLSKLRVQDEKRLNYWNTQLIYMHHCQIDGALVLREPPNHYYDVASIVSQASLMSTICE